MGNGKHPESFRFEIDEARNLIRLKIVGDVYMADVMTYMRNVPTNPGFRKGMNTLVDISLARFNVGTDEIWRLRELVGSIQEERGACSWAVVAKSDLHYGLTRMFSLITEGLKIKTEVFRTVEEALDWLGEPVHQSMSGDL